MLSIVPPQIGPVFARVGAASALLVLAVAPALSQEGPAPRPAPPELSEPDEDFGAPSEMPAPSPGADPSEDLDTLFGALREASPAIADTIVRRIWAEWSKSGSPSMDLLLERGRTALAEDDPQRAIGHLSALVDHAPEFAEGYNARATAYFRAGRYGPSLADIRTTLRLNPRHFGAMTGLATIMEELGMDEAALAAWREVVELNPHAEGAAASIARLSRAVEGEAL